MVDAEAAAIKLNGSNHGNSSAPGELVRKVSFSEQAQGHEASGNGSNAHHHAEPSNKFWQAVHFAQTNALPLLSGIVVALIWCNVDPESYAYVLGNGHHTFAIFGPDASFNGHTINIHYLINDIFMVLFFGIAAKEVTESCLPGGSLNPPRKALAPLIATVGGVAGPVAVYAITTALFYSAGLFDDYTTFVPFADDANSSAAAEAEHRRFLASSSSSGSIAGEYVKTPYPTIFHGWGVPTATDISLAWVCAVQVFPLRHPAIDFLLLLAVADDAIGLVIIAAVYTDPDHPPQPVWLLLCVGAVTIALALRSLLRLQHWAWYVILAGVPSWIGLSLARLHPALALVFVVPLLPASAPASRPNQLPTLQAFEHALKAPVDFGLFFFTLANAGVELQGGAGPLAVAVVAALVVGKLIGVTFLVLTASKLRIAPVNSQISAGDVTMVASMASVGLTVALFVAGVAFKNDARLQGEAKFGALLSGLMGLVCVGVSRLPCWRKGAAAPAKLPSPLGDAVSPPRTSRTSFKVSDEKLRGVAVSDAALEREDSYVILDVPASQSLGYRQPQYYRHAIRAGNNRMSMHFDKMERPSLFSIDPEASLRARGRWQSARVNPMDALNPAERSERAKSSVVSFLQKSASDRKLSATSLAAAAALGSSGAGAPSAGAAAPSAGVISGSGEAAPVVVDAVVEVVAEPAATPEAVMASAAVTDL